MTIGISMLILNLFNLCLHEPEADQENSNICKLRSRDEHLYYNDEALNSTIMKQGVMVLEFKEIAKNYVFNH